MQKQKLLQMKNKLLAEETKLKLKEQKARTKHLIEMGGLLVKSKLDYLPTDTLYGALLFLKEQIKSNEEILLSWSKKGCSSLKQEHIENYPVILKFNTTSPTKTISKNIRLLGMRFNKFRNEWHGNVQNLNKLKETIKTMDHSIEILENK
ncbi:MAG TPA: conjugal transfer protein TraD [Candidatus Megaira endosymbiont of Nemacystus decipiens]|nr:conjugal transfer protein TraD [Candidatus Megaera endosymbiont of Nemacystus decipiens]